MENNTCSKCHGLVEPTFFYCPTCGNNLKESSNFSTGKLVGIYAISILLPPLGLWPGIKYARHSDPKIKKIGWIAITLTVISFIVTSIISVGWLNKLNSQLQDLTGELEQLQDF